MAYAVAHDEATYDALLADYPRAYQPWLPVDEMILRSMSRSGAGEQEIAERLRALGGGRQLWSQHGVQVEYTDHRCVPAAACAPLA